MTVIHKSRLHPSRNKFHTGNKVDGKHYWITPPSVYAALDSEFHFDFDPCPYPLHAGFDGLSCDWGWSNYVNPPFGSIIHDGKKKGPTAWIRKAIEQQSKGRSSVVVYPLDKWILMALHAMGSSSIRNLGDVRWLSIEDGSPGPGTGRHIAAFIFTGNRRSIWDKSVDNHAGGLMDAMLGMLGTEDSSLPKEPK